MELLDAADVGDGLPRLAADNRSFEACRCVGTNRGLAVGDDRSPIRPDRIPEKDLRIETGRHEIEGTVQLPHEGFRSRMTDFLNTQGDDFLPLTDAEVTYLDGSRAPEKHEYLALAARQVILVVELGQIGTVEEPAPVAFTASAPPPGVG